MIVRERRVALLPQSTRCHTGLFLISWHFCLKAPGCSSAPALWAILNVPFLWVTFVYCKRSHFTGKWTHISVAALWNYIMANITIFLPMTPSDSEAWNYALQLLFKYISASLQINTSSNQPLQHHTPTLRIFFLFGEMSNTINIL